MRSGLDINLLVDAQDFGDQDRIENSPLLSSPPIPLFPPSHSQRQGGRHSTPGDQPHQGLALLGGQRRKSDPAVQPGGGEFSGPPPVSAKELRLVSRQTSGDFHMLPPKSAPR